MLQKIVSFVPSKIRAVALVFVVILIIFAVSKYMKASDDDDDDGTPPRVRKLPATMKGYGEGYDTPPRGKLQELVALAADSVNRASTAETVVDQLRHLTFGISQLEAAKIMVDGNVPRLSSMSGMDVPKLQAYLHHAENLCVAALKKNGSKGKSS
jgi:hypothetical protein